MDQELTSHALGRLADSRWMLLHMRRSIGLFKERLPNKNKKEQHLTFLNKTYFRKFNRTRMFLKCLWQRERKKHRLHRLLLPFRCACSRSL